MITRRGFLGTTVLAAQPPRVLRAGTAVVNITPALGCSIAGSMRNRIATDVHDQLHARALVLDNGEGRIAFVVADSCAIAREVIDGAKALIEKHAGVPPARVLISATHTHSAPAGARLFQSEPDPVYLDFLRVRMADAVRLAVNRLRPARIGWGIGKKESLLFNRRYLMAEGAVPPNPFGRIDGLLSLPAVGDNNVRRHAGPVDGDVSLLGVVGTDGKPLCALASYALHYVGGVPSATISADYFGVWAAEMERRLGGDCTGILANACSGDVNGVDVMGQPRTVAQYVRMGEVASELADESMRVWRGIEWRDWVELSGRVADLELGVRKPAAAEVEAARRLLPADFRDVTDRTLIYAKETVQLADYPSTVLAPVQGLRIGDLRIATLPGEAFTELGLEVKRRRKRTTFMIELANGYYGYIPTVEAHRLGGYETWRAKSSYLEIDAAPKLVDAVSALIVD